MSKNYIIYTNEFDINTGGIIVLHQLCDLINKMGGNAYLWPAYRPIFNINKPLKSLRQLFKYYRKDKNRSFKLNKSFNTPLASSKELKDSIVIYPEVVDGNPLNSKNIVRWLLHKPGFHTGRINFTSNELIFGFGKPCSGSGIEITEENTLIVKYIMTDIYKQKNFSERKGSCHMLRKGINKNLVHDKDSILVDNFSHEELSEIFNKVEYFISYDPYTYYSVYAVLCGCISIIIPDDKVSKEEWYPEIEDRYGKAYGMDDIEYAISTKPKMFEYLESQTKKNLDSVQSFMKKCEESFIK